MKHIITTLLNLCRPLSWQLVIPSIPATSLRLYKLPSQSIRDSVTLIGTFLTRQKVQLPAKAIANHLLKGPIADCHHSGVCAVNNSRCRSVDRYTFMNLHIRYVHWLAARLPNCQIWGFLSPTPATPTIRSIKCKQSPVYGVFWPLLPRPSTVVTKHKLDLPLSPGNLPIKFGTNPSTIFLVIVVRQTDRQTNAGKNIPLLLRG